MGLIGRTEGSSSVSFLDKILELGAGIEGAGWGFDEGAAGCVAGIGVEVGFTRDESLAFNRDCLYIIQFVSMSREQ